MKKAMFALALLTTMAFSEGLAFKKGEAALDLGFNVTYLDGVGAMLALDIGAINNMFSFGADVSFHGRKSHRYWYSLLDYEYRYRYLNPNFRFAFHPFGIPAIESKGKNWLSKLDSYAALKMGPKFEWERVMWHDEEISSSDAKASFYWGISLGCRFYVREKFHLFAEGGTGNWVFGIGFF